MVNWGSVAVGSAWAVVVPRRAGLACVRVTRLGTSEPQRFKIEFVADEFECRAETTNGSSTDRASHAAQP